MRPAAPPPSGLGGLELGFYSFGDTMPDPHTGERTPPGQRIRDLLERVRLAEQVGLDYAGIGEHHRPEYAVSAPGTVIAAALAQTSTIRVGSAVTVLSTEDPVRVFQQFTTMDQFSGGRVELLAGRGSYIESYPLYGAALEDYDDLFEEKVRLLLELDSQHPITWSGRFRPPLTDAVVLPRPVDKPGLGDHLRIGIATGGNPESSARAGELGLPVTYAIIGGRPADFAPLAGLYRDTFTDTGHGALPRVEIAVMGFVGETDAGARDFFYPYYLQTMRMIAAERGFPIPNKITYEATASPGGAYFIGAPESVAERVVALHEVLGHDRQVFQMDLTGVPQREALRAIELLGTVVKPLVDAALAGRAAEIDEGPTALDR
ncbi:LLM class flavin-dependent oxidoreductase [Occultella gossypii]|uniref:LLM class flavin-dependent oxidoreductase n=1 Tax=Occultella gossypii TaxID=2800820 RepID=UPI001CBAD7FC|nr:LLM class flavin-dependent oxidoreductase [Occultella gossypii]